MPDVSSDIYDYIHSVRNEAKSFPSYHKLSILKMADFMDEWVSHRTEYESCLRRGFRCFYSHMNLLLQDESNPDYPANELFTVFKARLKQVRRSAK